MDDKYDQLVKGISWVLAMVLFFVSVTWNKWEYFVLGILIFVTLLAWDQHNIKEEVKNLKDKLNKNDEKK